VKSPFAYEETPDPTPDFTIRDAFCPVKTSLPGLCGKSL
jgi:hypothetical protein